MDKQAPSQTKQNDGIKDKTNITALKRVSRFRDKQASSQQIKTLETRDK